ncbi:MAG TPA: hypothetical protein VMW17_07610 [Candidatus Binatia bacterium]|nr:hypothetical protein [Candidatus Binatia bacterium]
MTRIRKRLPEDVFEKVFGFVLKVAVEYGLLKGKTIAVDATTLEANAAMKSLVRRDTGQDWKAYVRGLAAAEGIENPTDEELRRFDKKRKKKTSNKDRKSATDPDSRVTKMKDGRTHLAYKAEHAVELGSGLIVAPVVYWGDDPDAETLPVTVELARQQLAAAGSPHQVEEVVGDKGYHKADTIQILEAVEQVRAYIAEPKRRGRRTWQDKPAGQPHVVYANRQRIKGERGRRLGRQRSEQAERSFAHTCETGGGRRAARVGARRGERLEVSPAAGDGVQPRAHHARAVRSRDTADSARSDGTPACGHALAAVVALSIAGRNSLRIGHGLRPHRHG